MVHSFTIMSTEYERRMSGYKDIKELGDILGFKIPVDGFLTALFGYPVIDIIAFDKKLIQLYDYEGRGVSMRDFLMLAFSERAALIVDANCEIDKNL